MECVFDNVKVTSWCHILFLCVLPSHLPNVAEEIRQHIPIQTLVYSFVGTYTSKRLKQLLMTTNVFRGEYTWTEESERNRWNYNINVNVSLENPTIVEQTCPVGFRKAGKYSQLVRNALVMLHT